MILRPALLLAALSTIAGAFPSNLIEKPNSWFRSNEGKEAVESVISWQSSEGSWPKNQNSAEAPRKGSRRELRGTFDNKATTDELRFLACACEATDDDAPRKSFLKGFDHILKSQYSNGGWPQYSPPGDGYPRHITLNDGTMIRLLEFLRETTNSKRYEFIGSKRREDAIKAINRGVECILRCQIVRDGKKTVWCAQHDERTLEPAMARSYELESLSGSESAGIVRFLMSIPDPSPDIVESVKGAVEWYKSSKVEGIRVVKIDGERRAVADRKSDPIWGRFYDIETNRPFFCDRDGVKKWDYNEIGKERRNGYAWYGGWGESVLKAYSKWPHR